MRREDTLVKRFNSDDRGEPYLLYILDKYNNGYLYKLFKLAEDQHWDTTTFIEDGFIKRADSPAMNEVCAILAVHVRRECF